ncbi:MAG: hypothetical protein ACK5L5_12340 [Bacteroidales bacterium]
MGRALSVDNVLTSKFNMLDFDGKWKDAVGTPERTGTWFIQAPPKSGKTTLAMLISKYLTKFGKVNYNSIEEGKSKTMQDAIIRADMKDVGRSFMLLDKEELDEMQTRLDARKSAQFVVIDSIQFMELKFSDYKMLKKRYPDKIFIYISHMKGTSPDGSVANKVFRDAGVTFRLEGFVAFPTSRYGGGKPIIVYEEGALKYWGLEQVQAFR